jgi:hypothetical protein
MKRAAAIRPVVKPITATTNAKRIRNIDNTWPPLPQAASIRGVGSQGPTAKSSTRDMVNYVVKIKHVM